MVFTDLIMLLDIKKFPSQVFKHEEILFKHCKYLCTSYVAEHSVSETIGNESTFDDIICIHAI